MNDVLSETGGTRGPELIPVALIVLREHASSNPSRETGWIDLIEWAAIALWKADKPSAGAVPDVAVSRNEVKQAAPR